MIADEKYKAELADTIYMLAEVYRDTASAMLVEAWAAFFSDAGIPTEEIKQAAFKIMGSRKYTKLPTPAELMEVIRPRVDNTAFAEIQATKVLKALHDLGPYKTPTFTDPITQKLMTTRWRWGDFTSNLETEQVKWWRKEFVTAYCQGKDMEAVPSLPKEEAAYCLKEINRRLPERASTGTLPEGDRSSYSPQKIGEVIEQAPIPGGETEE